MNEMNKPLVIEGYASRFYERDLAGDIVMPGAFSNSLHQRTVRNIRMLFQHDATEPIGIWHEIFENQTGLFVRGALFADGPRGRTARALVKRGSVDGLSIGFRSRQAKRSQNGRNLEEIDLWEVSIVTFPMLPRARWSVCGARPADAGPLGLLKAGEPGETKGRKRLKWPVPK